MTIKTSCVVKSVKHDINEIKTPALIIIVIFAICALICGLIIYAKDFFNAVNILIIISIIVDIIFILLSLSTPPYSNGLVDLKLPILLLSICLFFVSIFYIGPMIFPQMYVFMFGNYICALIGMVLMRAYARCINGED